MGYLQQLVWNLFQFQGIICEHLDGNPPLWSLSYEVWFYILAGSLSTLYVNRAVTRRVHPITIVAFAMALVSAWCLAMLRSVYLFCWLLGAVAYAWPIHQRSGMQYCLLPFSYFWAY